MKDGRRRLTELARCLDNLEQALNVSLPQHRITWRNSVCLEYMLAFERAWKAVQAVLAKDGVVVNSPRSAFAALVAQGLVEDDKIFNDMLDDRREIAHDYAEEDIEGIVESCPHYLIALRTLHDVLLRFWEQKA